MTRRRQLAERVTVLGLAVNVALGLAKLLAGVLGSSTALIADAVESLTDVVGSVLIWGGLKLGSLPPDENHPYGHGRAESLAALAVALLILAAGISVIVAAVSNLFGENPPPKAWTLIVLVVVIIAKETMFRVAQRAARRAGSSAVLADAWHHRTDAVSSLAALLGVSVAVYAGPGWGWADEAAAMLAAGVILYNGLRLIRHPIHELMDAEAPSADLIEPARRAALSVEGILGVEKVLARRAGMQSHLDMHLEVDPGMSVRDAHELGHRAQEAVLEQVPGVADVLVHIEPHATDRNIPSERRG